MKSTPLDYLKKKIMDSKGSTIAKKVLEKRKMEESYMNDGKIEIPAYTTNSSVLGKK